MRELWFSPLSTQATHKILGSQKAPKRILDGLRRVAFYRRYAPVAGVAGKFGRRPFFPDFVRFARIPPVYEAGGSVGALGFESAEKGELSDWKKSSVNTTFSVCD
jgi:hypothetical protein